RNVSAGMSSLSPTPVILITGCSTGFVRSLALEALSRGMRVIPTARRVESIQDLGEKGSVAIVKALALDVTAPRDILRNFAAEAIAAFGQIDILVNNAGYLLAGAVEEDSEEQMRSQFDTNFFGLVNLT
ncbi:hypothetical protein MPER_00483, partial [Moniliophthora perniciosa FA553]